MKSTSKFKTISEVSKESNVPQHVLRFWENKFTQLSPLKLSGNRRYYRKIDVELIAYIKNLLYVDAISIRGVQKIFGRQTINKILKSKNPLLNKINTSGFTNTKTTDEGLKKTIQNTIVDLKKIKSFLDK